MDKLSKKILQSILHNLSLGVLLAVWIGLIWTNFIPGTWLTGWDNLHPEMNFPWAVKSSLASMWQSSEGLGMLRGMGLAADLSRVIFLWLISLFVETNALRYLWTFLMLLSGPLGAYVLAKHLFKNPQQQNKPLQLIGFTAGLVYLCNLATVQYFYVPFETFIGFYGFLPWFIWISIRYLQTGGIKNLLLLVTIFILGASAFYVQTLFLVLMIVMSILLIETSIRMGWLGIRRSLILLLVIGLVNSYWLIQVAYFSATGLSDYKDIKQISIATEEQQLMNQYRGGLENIALLRGFWFDQTDFDQNGQAVFLFEKWRDHVDKPLVSSFGYSIFVIAWMGLLLRNLWNRRPWISSVFAMGVLTTLMLTAGKGVIGSTFDTLSGNIPFFSQVFRSPFTKWSGVMALVLALGSATFVDSFYLILKRYVTVIGSLIVVLIFAGSIYYLQPAFTGQLIYDRLQLQIPQEYFELVTFLQSQPKDAKIVYLPIDSHWGWNYYTWGYRGSGFLWHAIEQPLLHRSFDAWSIINESAYFQLKQTIDSQDSEQFKSYLQKYDISLFLVDNTVYDSLFNNQGQSHVLSKALLENVGAKIIWQGDNLELYALNQPPEPHDEFDQIKTNNPRLVKDAVWSNVGNYFSSSDTEGDYYPFQGIYSSTRINSLTVSEIEDAGIAFGQQLPGGDLVVPGYNFGEKILLNATITYQGDAIDINIVNPLRLKINGQDTLVYETPLLRAELETFSAKPVWISIGGKFIRLSLDEEKQVNGLALNIGRPLQLKVFDATQLKTMDLTQQFLSSEVFKCWNRSNSQGEVITERNANELNIATKDAAGCLSMKLDILEYPVFMEVILPYKSDKDSRPNFCVVEPSQGYKCVHTDVFYNTDPSESWTSVERRFELDKEVQYWMDITARPSDIVGELWDIAYREPVIKYYPLIADYEFEDIIWSEFTNERIIRVASESNLEIDLLTTPILTNEVSNTSQWYFSDCDLFSRGKSQKEVLPEGLVKYSNQNLGSGCDFTILDGVNSNDDYLLRVSAENITGRPLKLYVNDLDGNTVILESLLPKQQTDAYYGMYGNNNPASPGYKLTIESRSFGSIAENDVRDLELYPLPTKWLSQIRLTNFENTKMGFIKDISWLKKTSSHYVAKVNTRAESILNLNQSYYVGWQGFIVNNSIQESWPWIGGQKLDHVQVNGWANGWIVPEGDHTIVIVFWPQYLQWLGFGLLGVTVLGLFATGSWRLLRGYQARDKE